MRCDTYTNHIPSPPLTSLYSVYIYVGRGDWMTDRLTMAEKLAYDRAMGYVTINSHSTKGTKGGIRDH